MVDSGNGVYINALTTISPALMLIAGFILCFFGYRLLRFTLALAGFAVGLALGLAAAGLIHGVSQVFMIIIGVVCGILGALVSTLIYKVGVFLLGAGAGVLLAGIILTATGWHNPMLVRVIAAVAGGILTLIIERPLVSILSAFAGAWGIAFGAFHLLGWYHVAASAKSPPANYGSMIVCWLVLGLIGAGVQLRSGGGKKKDEG
jgi:hypothetical protein